MRIELKNLGSEKRYTFTARVGRQGTKPGWQGEIIDTILLNNVKLKENGKEVTSHIWFILGTNFENSECQEGDIIEFSARVSYYEKGWRGKKAEEYGESRTEKDWKLERPTKIKIIQKVSFEEIERREKAEEAKRIEDEKCAEEVSKARKILLVENEKINKFYDENLSEFFSILKLTDAKTNQQFGNQRKEIMEKIKKFKTANRNFVIKSNFDFFVFKEILSQLPKSEWTWYELTEDLINKIKFMEIAK